MPMLNLLVTVFITIFSLKRLHCFKFYRYIFKIFVNANDN